MSDLTNKVVTHMLLYADQTANNRPSYVYTKQYDANSRYLVVTIMTSAGQYMATGLARLNAHKPDGTHAYISGEINDDGTITFALTSQLLAAEGQIGCDVTIFDTSGENIILTTSTFYILVGESYYDGDASESINQLTIVVEPKELRTVGATYTFFTDSLDNKQWYGVTLDKEYIVSHVILYEYRTGDGGGWFSSTPSVQAQVKGVWVDTATTISPAYPGSSANESYTFTLKTPIECSAVRVIGEINTTAGHASPMDIDIYGNYRGNALTYAQVVNSLNTKINECLNEISEVNPEAITSKLNAFSTELDAVQGHLNEFLASDIEPKDLFQVAKLTGLTNGTNPQGAGSRDINVIVDGVTSYGSDMSKQYDTFNATFSDDLGVWFGAEIDEAYAITQVNYWTGALNNDGGWFGSAPKLDCYIDGNWVETSATLTPAYPGTAEAANYEANACFSFILDEPVMTSKVRVRGEANTYGKNISCTEIQVFGTPALISIRLKELTNQVDDLKERLDDFLASEIVPQNLLQVAKLTGLTNGHDPQGAGSRDINVIVDGITDFGSNMSLQYDTFNATFSDTSGVWFGAEIDKEYAVTKVVYWPGAINPDGGWFGAAPVLDCYVDGAWKEVSATVTPAYKSTADAPNYSVGDSFAFILDEPIMTNKVRVRGIANKYGTNISCVELQVFGTVALINAKINDLLNKKVTHTDNASMVYVTDASGTDAVVQYTSDNVASTIALRTSAGQLTVSDATADNHAVGYAQMKTYVKENSGSGSGLTLHKTFTAINKQTYSMTDTECIEALKNGYNCMILVNGRASYSSANVPFSFVVYPVLKWSAGYEMLTNYIRNHWETPCNVSIGTTINYFTLDITPDATTADATTSLTFSVGYNSTTISSQSYIYISNIEVIVF